MGLDIVELKNLKMKLFEHLAADDFHQSLTAAQFLVQLNASGNAVAVGELQQLAGELRLALKAEREEKEKKKPHWWNK